MDIEELIPGLNLENDTIEFKEILAEGPRKGDPSKRLEEGWLKEMVAFANTKGGTMIVGVVDATHEIKPFDNRTLDKIVLMVHRLVKQHIGDDIKYRISTIAIPGAAPSTYIIRIDIEKAENPPVTLKFGGVPSVYVRHFGLTSPATGEEIRDLVLNSESISFDQPFTEEDFDKTQFTLLYNECRKARGSVPTVKELMSIGFVSTEGKLAKGAVLFKDGYSSEKEYGRPYSKPLHAVYHLMHIVGVAGQPGYEGRHRYLILLGTGKGRYLRKQVPSELPCYVPGGGAGYIVCKGIA